MPVIEAERLSFRYGSVVALEEVGFEVPEGAVYALLGPNGSGKTTLLQILSGLRRPRSGRASILGREVGQLRSVDRTAIGYLAEGQPLPAGMRLGQLESYLAPLYPKWDSALAGELRARFGLDPRRKLTAMSRGERTKAALLCTLAPRPSVVLMDEPFAGLDVVVKDEIVSGLLESAATEGWTVVIASHDLDELEVLADWVGLLDDGHLWLSESMDSVRARFRRIELVLGDDAEVSTAPDWLAVRRVGRRISFLTAQGDEALIEADVRARHPGLVRFEAVPASLRDIFVAVTGGQRTAEQEHAVIGGVETAAERGER